MFTRASRGSNEVPFLTGFGSEEGRDHGNDGCVSHQDPRVVGRKLTLTPEVADRIVELLRADNRLTTALGVVAINPSVYYRWHLHLAGDTRGRRDDL